MPGIKTHRLMCQREVSISKQMYRCARETGCHKDVTERQTDIREKERGRQEGEIIYPSIKVFIKSGEPFLKWKLSTVNLLVLTSSNLYKTSHLNEVNCIEPASSVNFSLGDAKLYGRKSQTLRP
jgi:hypothetical protein